jgi:hypothetical protein
MLAGDLKQALLALAATTPAEIGGQIREIAHKLVATAGHLGAAKLSHAAADLSRLQRSSPGDDRLAQAVGEIRTLAGDSLAALERRFGPGG